jgi:phosphoglycolate phosphatase-like HAD superfamily hydrolase
MMKLALFDIDMTLIYTAGAGRRAMMTVMQELFGENGFADTAFAGRTDTAIFKDGLAGLDIAWRPDREQAFKEKYFKRLEIELQRPNPESRIHAGIIEILNTLQHREDITVALLTGNWREAARIKLSHFNLWQYFAFGAFSDDAEQRDELPAIAAARFSERTGRAIAPQDVYVIGDTPLDVACARPFGAVSVAVATGFYTVQQLQAAGPGHLFQDLADVQAFMRVFSS